MMLAEESIMSGQPNVKRSPEIDPRASALNPMPSLISSSFTLLLLFPQTIFIGVRQRQKQQNQKKRSVFKSYRFSLMVFCCCLLWGRCIKWLSGNMMKTVTAILRRYFILCRRQHAFPSRNPARHIIVAGTIPIALWMLVGPSCSLLVDENHKIRCLYLR